MLFASRQIRFLSNVNKVFTKTYFLRHIFYHYVFNNIFIVYFTDYNGKTNP